MKIIAIYNIKGGVGKTATAVNLAFQASLDGANTLLWDLDPQGAASYYCRIKPKIKGGGKKLIAGKVEIAEAIKGTDYENLDLLPADFSYRNMDIFLDQAKKPLKRLNKYSIHWQKNMIIFFWIARQVFPVHRKVFSRWRIYCWCQPYLPRFH